MGLEKDAQTGRSKVLRPIQTIVAWIRDGSDRKKILRFPAISRYQRFDWGFVLTAVKAAVVISIDNPRL